VTGYRSDDDIKRDIIARYDGEAVERDSDEWLAQGGTARVPESRAAHYFIERKVRMALALSAAERQWRVHEIGCSFGHMTSLLAREFDHLIASDLSPRSVEVARKRLERYGIDNVNVVVADAENLEGFDDASFDITYSFSTVRFCPNPDRALAEMRRTLTPGGRLVVDFPNRLSPWHFLLKPLAGIQKHEHDRLYTKAEAVQLVHDAGFSDVHAVEFLFTTKRLPNAVLPFFKAADRLLEPTPLRRLAGIIMVSARRP
jgi:ubiquinone/menaquinone biosynthesis C-methylase UbiE